MTRRNKEAIQAAHGAICETDFDDCLEWRGKCVKAVEAAAPVLMAEAWENGEVAGRSYAMRLMSDEPLAPKPTNPHRFMKGQP